ncbi:hypothetical protein [Pseudaminobacter sp. NGMCC 1.201702]|uniref:hypothetical protein n=1 Tax=Pseudaminobacter sp. NGMCC 1.201702 TaxID=3391825 RepID=UPI0039F03CAC
MVADKPWYMSRTIWAALIAVLSASGGLIGVPIDDVDQAALLDTALQLVSALAGAGAVVGRLLARNRIA